MLRNPIPADVADAIWCVLVEECGCRDDPRDRSSFTHYLGASDWAEWRFQGALGFGGKFYNDHFSWRVGCYREDDTPERLAMMARANARLAAMRVDYIAGTTDRDGSDAG